MLETYFVATQLFDQSSEAADTPADVIRLNDSANRDLRGSGEVQAFRHLRAHGVVLVGRDRDRGQNAE